MKKALIRWMSFDAMLLLACGQNSLEPSQPKCTFEATVNGTVSRNVNGMAFFHTQSGIFSLAMANTDGTALIHLARASGGIPGTGTYSVSDSAGFSSENFIGMFVASSGDTGETYLSESGTVTVSASSSEALQGDFTFTARSLPDQSGNVTISGSFHAGRIASCAQ